MLVKAFEVRNLPNITLANLNHIPDSQSIATRGIQGDNLLEPVPSYIRRDGDKIIEGANNAAIVLGRDRPGEVGSGYGAQTGAGTIDIVTGRLSSVNQTSVLSDTTMSRELVSTDPNLSLDASRIYISQKTDIDKNFNLAAGLTGLVDTRAAIAMKSDVIRVIGREGVKIVTKTDATNSLGAGIISIPKIELIAGNDDSQQEPAVKGTALTLVLSEIIQKVLDLNQVLDSFMTAQIEYNAAIMKHEHPSPVLMTLGALGMYNPQAINGGNLPLSPELLHAGIKAIGMQQISKKDGIQNSLQSTITAMSSTEIHGGSNPISTNITLS